MAGIRTGESAKETCVGGRVVRWWRGDRFLLLVEVGIWEEKVARTWRFYYCTGTLFCLRADPTEKPSSLSCNGRKYASWFNFEALVAAFVEIVKDKAAVPRSVQ